MKDSLLPPPLRVLAVLTKINLSILVVLFRVVDFAAAAVIIIIIIILECNKHRTLALVRPVLG